MAEEDKKNEGIYQIEAYILEIRLDNENTYAIKLKPTEEFMVKIPDESRELSAMVDIGNPRTGKFKGTDEFFALLCDDKGPLVGYEFILSLKHHHDKVLFKVNAEDKIISLTVK